LPVTLQSHVIIHTHGHTIIAPLAHHQHATIHAQLTRH